MLIKFHWILSNITFSCKGNKMWTEESARVYDFRLAKGNLSFCFYFSVSSILFVSHKRLYSPSSLMFIMICESTLVQTKFSSTIIFFVVFSCKCFKNMYFICHKIELEFDNIWTYFPVQNRFFITYCYYLHITIFMIILITQQMHVVLYSVYSIYKSLQNLPSKSLLIPLSSLKIARQNT